MKVDQVEKPMKEDERVERLKSGQAMSSWD
jgi:hypothetical protein